MDKFTTITVERVTPLKSSLNGGRLNAVTPAMADEAIAYFSGSMIA